MNKHNSNGYNVCYKEKYSKQYIRYFITYTYKQARYAMQGYILYPPRDRQDYHKLIEPTWEIIPIKNSEVRYDIWRKVPF